MPYYEQPTETSARWRRRGPPVALTSFYDNEKLRHIYILLYLKEAKVQVLFLYEIPLKKILQKEDKLCFLV